MSLSIKAGRLASGGRLREDIMLEQRLMGDPGLFGFLKKVGKKALGVAGGFLTGGAVGAAGALIPRSRPASPGIPSARGLFPQGVPAPQSFPVLRTPGVRGAVQRALPGGRTGFEVQVDGMMPPKGMRLNKSSYFLKDGTFVPAGTRFVKVRRRNPLNPRALDRAISRVESAKKASRKLSRITVRKKCPS